MKRVLVVDDDPQVLDLLARWLTAAGYEVERAATFAEGKQRLDKPLDALVVDVRLLDFNGLQLAGRARATHPNLRIVVMSGWDDPVLVREASALGAIFLKKPLSENDLLQAL
jgi:two-component system, response regulator YesN